MSVLTSELMGFHSGKYFSAGQQCFFREGKKSAFYHLPPSPGEWRLLEGQVEYSGWKTGRLLLALPEWKAVDPAKHTDSGRRVTRPLARSPLTVPGRFRQDGGQILALQSLRGAGVGAASGAAGGQAGKARSSAPGAGGAGSELCVQGRSQVRW